MSKSQVERECILCINSIIQYNEAMSFKLLHGTILTDNSHRNGVANPVQCACGLIHWSFPPQSNIKHLFFLFFRSY